VDDADRGRRGLRARPGPDLSRALRDHWGPRVVPGGIDLGGSSSLNLLVSDGDRRYVARVHRPHVTPERLGAIQLARGALAAGGVPAIPPVPTRQGAPWASVGGRLLEVEAWVDHDAVMDSWERLAAAMGLLARAHDLLGGVETGDAGRRPRFANHLEPADVLAWTRRGTTRIRGWGPTAEEAGLADAADQLAERVAEAEAGLVPRLPRQLVHGDFWDDNVLFRHGRPVLLADFDFMGERARVDDLALTLHHAGSDLGAGPRELPARLARLAGAYDRGLEVPLSDAERAALPLAMARQSLSAIGGWVARLDDETAARGHAARAWPEVTAALRMLDDLGRWRGAFARPG
jgi:Ser/Thr protein kinase RdoA (MazF antagonist)